MRTPTYPLHVRAPDIGIGEGPLLWSDPPEFCLAYNGYSVVIPYVEYYLNSIMNRVRAEHCTGKPELEQALIDFVKQEVNHSRYHVRFNQRMLDQIPELKVLVERVVADLRRLRETRSLAFNAAYCAGFESIATYDAQYLHEECDAHFVGADPRGANLLLWHVAEEFEHRAICHDAFHAVSGNFFLRLYGLVYAFMHIGAAFVQAEDIVLRHYWRGLTETQRHQSQKRSRRLFWRQLRYVAPRMLKVFLPGYNPRRLRTPARIQASLDFFRRNEPLRHLDLLGTPRS